MKKESFIAVFLGILLGLGVATVMIIKSRDQNTTKNKPLTTNNSPTPTVSISNLQMQGLEISSPVDGGIVNSATIKINGKAAKQALIVIQSPIKDMVVQNEGTDFSYDFPLALGENVIKIAVYPKDQSIRSQEKELRVYYLDEK
jgi:hypothetical protein